MHDSRSEFVSLPTLRDIRKALRGEKCVRKMVFSRGQGTRESMNVEEVGKEIVFRITVVPWPTLILLNARLVQPVLTQKPKIYWFVLSASRPRYPWRRSFTSWSRAGRCHVLSGIAERWRNHSRRDAPVINQNWHSWRLFILWSSWNLTCFHISSMKDRHEFSSVWRRYRREKLRYNLSQYTCDQ